jgi:broad specificity phosphatase PhoE
MAENLAKVVLADEHLSKTKHIYVSPLLRAKQTVAPIERVLGLKAIEDVRVIEASNNMRGLGIGHCDGSFLVNKNWKNLLNPFKPSWGELYVDIAKRTSSFIEEIKQRHAGSDNIIVVSHQSPIWVCRRFYERKTLWYPHTNKNCNLASVTTLLFGEKENFILAKYTDTVEQAGI